MQKKFLRISFLLAFLCGANSEMGAVPGADELRDDFGQRAPASVMRAAENLWRAVDADGEQAWICYRGIERRIDQTACSDRWCYLLCCCGMDCCSHDFKPGALGYRPKAWIDRPAYYDVYAQEADQKYMRAMSKEWKKIRVALNNAMAKYAFEVSRHVVDAPSESTFYKCDLGQWTHLAGSDWVSNGPYLEVGHARRDTSQVTTSTRAYVNGRGGWSDLPWVQCPEDPL